MKDIKLKFTITKRDGKNSLWVNNLNIWDLNEEECTYDVMKALVSAVERGVKLERESRRDMPCIYVGGDEKWIKQKVKE